MLEKRLHCVTAAEPGEQWKQMKTILHETTAEDWFDETDKEIQELLEKNHSCHNRLLAKPGDQAAKAAYKTARSTLQAKLRTMQNNWWTGLAERTQRYADIGDMCASYEAEKAVCGPSHQIQAPLRSSDGSTPRQTRKPSSSAGQKILKAYSATNALCRSFHWPRFPKWT